MLSDKLGVRAASEGIFSTFSAFLPRCHVFWVKYKRDADDGCTPIFDLGTCEMVVLVYLYNVQFIFLLFWLRLFMFWLSQYFFFTARLLSL